MFILLFLHQFLFHLQINANSQTESIKRFEFINFIKLEDGQTFDKNTNSTFKSTYLSNSENQFKNVEHTSSTYLNNTAYIRIVKFDRQQQLLIDLISLDHQFSMILFPSTPLSVIAHQLNQSTHLNITCYTGILQNSPSNSRLFAYFYHNRLNAIISAFDDVFHLEELDNQTVIMYKESDLNSGDRDLFDSLQFNRSSISLDQLDISKSQNKQTRFPVLANKRKLLFSNARLLYPYKPAVCGMEIIVDHTFAAYFNHDRVRISSEVFLRIMYVNSVYLNADFNSDGRPDGISVQVDRIIIFHTPNDKGYYWSDINLTPTEVLNQMGFRIQTHCLSFTFIHRDFGNFGGEIASTLGVAWVSKPSNSNGICGKPVINSFLSKKSFWVGNTGLVTNINRGKLRTRAQISSTLAHEIGHSFGANHDDLNEAMSTIGKCPSIYLMSAYDQQASTKNQFSKCSKLQIDPVLRLRSDCFRPYQSNCGNGILDYGEECDCGPAFVCAQINSCCQPNCRLKSECTKQTVKLPYNWPPHKPPNAQQPTRNYHWPHIPNQPNLRPSADHPTRHPLSYPVPNNLPNRPPNDRLIHYHPMPINNSIKNGFKSFPVDDEEYVDGKENINPEDNLDIGRDANDEEEEDIFEKTSSPVQTDKETKHSNHSSFESLLFIALFLVPIFGFAMCLLITTRCCLPEPLYRERRKKRKFRRRLDYY